MTIAEQDHPPMKVDVLCILDGETSSQNVDGFGGIVSTQTSFRYTRAPIVFDAGPTEIWSNYSTEIECPECGGKMELEIQSHRKEYLHVIAAPLLAYLCHFRHAPALLQEVYPCSP
jgi:hypothetical protein